MRYLIFYSVLGLAVGARVWLGRKYLPAVNNRLQDQSLSSIATRSA